MVGKNIGHGGFMIEIKNIVKTLSPERNPSTRLKTDNSRLFGVLAEPCSVTYAKVRALVRTCQEPQKSIKLSVFNDYVRLFEFGNVRIIICWLLVEKQITDELLKSASKYARLDNKKRPWERSFFVGA